MGRKKVADMYTDAVQQVLNEIHKSWQDTDVSMQDLFRELPAFKKFLFAMAKLNYQVENGGFSQWIYHQYADDTAEYLEDTLARITKSEAGAPLTTLKKVYGLLTRVREALEEAEGTGNFDWSKASEVLEQEDIDRESDNDTDSNVDKCVDEGECDLARTLRNLNDDISKNKVLVFDHEITLDDIREFRINEDAYGPIEVVPSETSFGNLEQLEEHLRSLEPTDDAEQGEIDDAVDIVGRVIDLEPVLKDLETLIANETDDPGLRFALDFLDSEYYKLDSGAIWKDVAHAAETMAELEDFKGVGTTSETK